MNIDKAIEILEEKREYEGTEVGKTWGILCDLYNRRDYITDKFKKQVIKEIITEAEFVEKNYVFVDEVIEHQQTVRNLKFIG